MVNILNLLISSSNLYQYYYVNRKYDNLPRKLNSRENNSSLDLLDIIISIIQNGYNQENEWLMRLTINGEMVTSLINNAGDSAINTLSYIGNTRIRRTLPIKALPAPKIRKILKIARNSIDRSVLTGCWVALSSSKFVKMAGMETMIKLMKYSNKPEFTSNIFNNSPSSKPSWDQDELIILVQVAETISKDPNSFNSAIVTSAGSFLAEHYKVNMPPLTHDEEKLRIKIREL
ncbi:MAG TPA: hypothetical protein VFS21_01970, partial [Roseiflexaceae bacterium]|nr:hypothetical protein [Roseiflexaceae bacterium]